MKSQLPKNNQKFSYISNHKSIIYSGSVIEKCNAIHPSGSVYALVLNTGINTTRGNSIQNIFFQTPTNFSMSRPFMIFIMIILFAFIVNVFILVFYYGRLTNKYTAAGSTDKKLKDLDDFFKGRLFGLFSSLCPPSLFICLAFIAFYFQYKLGNKNIQCVSDIRLYAAGNANVLILDKTGTMTEDDLELYGFQTTLVNELNSNLKKSKTLIK